MVAPSADPESLLQRARAEREGGRFDDAQHWLDAASAAADRPTVYPSVKGAIDVERLALMVARGDIELARQTLPSLIEQNRRRPMTEFPLQLIEIELTLTARCDGIAAAREALGRWERQIRRDWGAGTGAHDAFVRSGVQTLVAHGARTEAGTELRSLITLLERKDLTVSAALRALSDDLDKE